MRPVDNLTHPKTAFALRRSWRVAGVYPRARSPPACFTI